MKIAFCSLALGVFLVLPVRADLTITYSTTVQPASKPEEPPTASPAANNMTIKIKGDKMRIDASPKMTTIFDGKTGEVINLMHDQKAVIRISPEKLKAVSDMLERFKSQKGAEVKPALKPTGQKEVVSGYETEPPTGSRPIFPTAPPSWHNSNPSNRSFGMLRIPRCQISAISPGCRSGRGSF